LRVTEKGGNALLLLHRDSEKSTEELLSDLQKRNKLAFVKVPGVNKLISEEISEPAVLFVIRHSEKGSWASAFSKLARAFRS
jgi:hypothetical protein